MSYATKYDQVSREREADKIAERKVQRKSLLDTGIVMAILLGIVFLLRIPPVYPPLPDASGGMDIILGNDAVGMNDTKEGVMAGAPQNTPQAASMPEQVQAAQPQPTPMDTKDPNAVDVKDQKPVKTSITPPVNPTKTTTTAKPHPAPAAPARTANPNDMFTKSNHPGHGGTGGTGYSKGTGNTPGDQGGKNGIPDGGWEKYGSGKEGTGTGFFLAGRGKIALPNPNCSTQLEGKDVVQIVVDENGRVIEAHGGYRGSTITDPNVIACDEIAAKKARFTSSAATRQNGSISYIHKLQ